ncbi:MAG: DUF523 domain-containing protein [Thermodesulfobacteriota bacterium]|nr:DUF523 domain-containing protein [Thermodesulfobacteriota bacterium]
MKYDVILVSACLLGVNCRHDGGHAYCPEVFDELFNRHFIPVCPEQLGGLPTPRIRAHIERGDGRDVCQGSVRVINKMGEDVTASFLQGAKETLGIAQMAKAKKAILKDKSPSCGCQSIYRQESPVKGVGVTAALLSESGLEVVSETGEPIIMDKNK